MSGIARVHFAPEPAKTDASISGARAEARPPARSGVVALVVVVVVALFAGACEDPPAACADPALVTVDDVVARAEKIYARAAVNAAVDSRAAANAELLAQDSSFALFRGYERAAALCTSAAEAARVAAAAVDAARARRAQSDRIVVEIAADAERARLAERTGRALLDALPNAPLDLRLREAAAAAQRDASAANTTVALVQGGGWSDELRALVDAKAALGRDVAELASIVVDIRAAATARCKPKDGKRPLFFGDRARSHDGFAIVEAGSSDGAARGFTAVITSAGAACRTLYVKAASDPLALPIDDSVALSTWRVGGADALEVRMLFAWSGRRAWFIGENGRWAFDAAKVSGFGAPGAGAKCATVTCSDPVKAARTIDVKCTCTPNAGVVDLDLARDVRFSWHGNAMLAER